MSRLKNMILQQWQDHLPEMVAQLTQQRKLEATLRRAEKRATDLLYDYLMVQKLEYISAWELTMREILPNASPPEISASPTTSKSVKGAFTKKLLKTSRQSAS